MHIEPAPTEEEAAAIAAAVEVAWPRAGGGTEPSDRGGRWRFAGRWWTQPIPLRRNRPL